MNILKQIPVVSEYITNNPETCKLEAALSNASLPNSAARWAWKASSGKAVLLVQSADF